MSFPQDWIFPKAFIDELDATELINNVPGRRKNLISRTIWLMEDITKTLNLDRKVMTTAAVYFHRFYMFHSFNDQDRLPVAVACLFLASKVEEKPLKIRDIVAGFHSVYNRKPIDPDFQKKVLLCERILLNTLAFELNVAHPLLVCGNKLKELRGYASDENNKAIYQSAVNFINDSYRSTLCLQFSSTEIGMSLLFLATVQVGVKPVAPQSGRAPAGEVSWLELLSKEVDEETIRNVCLQILDFYGSEAFMMQPKDLDSLRRSTHHHLGLPEPVEAGVQESKSAGGGGVDGESYDQMLEQEAEKIPRKVTIERFLNSSSHNVSMKVDEEIGQSGGGEQSPQSVISGSFAPSSIGRSEFTPATGASSDYPDESPMHFIPPPPPDTPNSPSGGFADLPKMKMRERAVSISEDSCSGDFKRQRSY